MSSEEELPEELDKLEITPTLPQIKLRDHNLPLALNPFFDRSLTKTPNEETRSQRTQPSNGRKGRLRSCSESVVDDYKLATPVPVPNTPESVSLARHHPPGGVHRQSLKKTVSYCAGGVGGRKVVIREPLLRALQTCLHPQSSVRRKLLSLNCGDVEDNNVSLTSRPNDVARAGRGISDFRDLIEECSALLVKDVDFSGKMNQLSLSNRSSKNFTVTQTPTTKSRHKQTPRNRDNGVTGVSGGRSDTEDVAAEVNSINGSTRTDAASSPDHSITSRRSTSCSQQAGGTTSAAGPNCDDVTIDELASYFDTFVHIPKKMSSMAEMMYI